MAIVRGTTPTLVFHIKDKTLDLNEIAQVWITFKNKAGFRPKEITYDIDDVIVDSAEHTITLYLSQNNTLALSECEMSVQIRIRFNDDKAYASNILNVPIGRILKEGVI